VAVSDLLPRWNKEKLIEKYMENPETVCREAGMANLSRLSTQPTNPNEKVQFAFIITS
jgi:hypothetical protein